MWFSGVYLKAEGEEQERTIGEAIAIEKNVIEEREFEEKDTWGCYEE